MRIGLIGDNRIIKNCIINASIETNGYKLDIWSSVGDSAAEKQLK